MTDTSNWNLWRFEGHEYDDEGNAYQEYLYRADERYTSGDQIREAICDLFRQKLKTLGYEEMAKLTYSRGEEAWRAYSILEEALSREELLTIGIEPASVVSDYAGEWDDFYVSVYDEGLEEIAAQFDAYLDETYGSASA